MNKAIPKRLLTTKIVILSNKAALYLNHQRISMSRNKSGVLTIHPKSILQLILKNKLKSTLELSQDILPCPNLKSLKHQAITIQCSPMEYMAI